MDWFISKLRFVGSAITWLIYKIYSKKALESSVVITARPDGEALTIYCNQNGAINLWLRINNFTPFKCKTEHCSVSVIAGGIEKQFSPKDRPSIPAFYYYDIFLKTDLSENQAKAIAESNDKPYIECNLEMKAKFGLSIQKQKTLQQIPYRKI